MKARSLLTLIALASLPVAAGTATGAEPACQRWDLEVVCQTNPSRVIVTDPFTATVTVRNTGDVALTNVQLDLRTDLGARTVDGKPSPKTVIEKLEPGQSQQISGVFACDTVGITRILGGARDSLGWAAASCACTVDVIGLPAVQSEMTDKDLQGKEKGIFVTGETFQYVLDVQNDAGTTVTPDLKVVFTLPKELEFVSGTGDHAVTVAGKDQSAETSTFVLAPNEKAKISIQVKALSAPQSHWAQVKASIQTTGGIEVAVETESTTLKD